MSNTWIIADTHLYHKNMCEYCGRPKDFTERIISNWCRLVANDDLIYHLGDIAMCNRNVMSQVIRRLPGRKILIIGNHDGQSVIWYTRNGWQAAERSITLDMDIIDWAGITLKGVVLSHLPTHDPSWMTDVNIHGHFHNNPLEHCDQSLVANLEDRHYLLALEYNNYSPVLLQTAISSGSVIQTITLKHDGGKA